MRPSTWVCPTALIIGVVFVYRNIIVEMLAGSQHEISDDSIADRTRMPWLIYDVNDKSQLKRRIVNLNLKVIVDKNEPTTQIRKCRDISTIMYNTTSSKCITFTEVERRHEADFKIPEIYDIYPQDVPMQEVVKRVKASLPVAQEPIFNVPLCVLRSPKNVCGLKQKYDVVIIVKSGVLNFDNRIEFRKLIKKQLRRQQLFSFAIVFSLGLPRKFGANRFVRNGIPYKLSGRYGKLMVRYDGRYNKVMQRLNKEINQYDDILLGDYEDTYYELTVKASFNFRWAAAFCANATSTVLIQDDDIVPNIFQLNQFLKKNMAIDRSESLLADWWIGIYSTPDPTYKYYIAENDTPWQVFAPFPHGRAMFIGNNLLERLAIAAAFTKPVRMDDIWIGLICAKMNITPKLQPELHVPNLMTTVFFELF